MTEHTHHNADAGDHPDAESSHPPVAHPGKHRGPVTPAIRGALLMGLAIYFGYLGASGNIGNYVNVRFGWVAYVSAALCALFAINSVVAWLRGPRTALEALHVHFGHNHQSMSWPVFTIVAIPLALGTLVPSQPLGATAIAGDLYFGGGTGDSALISSPDSLQWTIMDWLRAFSGHDGADRVNAKEADVTGFVYRRDGDPPGYFIVSRFLMIHCTADAYAIGLPVHWQGAEELPVDTWIRARGRMRVGRFGDNTLPILGATAVEERIERPSQVYLYQ